MADREGDEHSILLCCLLSHAKSVCKKSTEYYRNCLNQKGFLLHFEAEGFAEALGVAYFTVSYYIQFTCLYQLAKVFCVCLCVCDFICFVWFVLFFNKLCYYAL